MKRSTQQARRWALQELARCLEQRDKPRPSTKPAS